MEWRKTNSIFQNRGIINKFIFQITKVNLDNSITAPHFNAHTMAVFLLKYMEKFTFSSPPATTAYPTPSHTPTPTNSSSLLVRPMQSLTAV